ncbi:pentatricopeptide repeat-containing protein At2g17140 isoform X2 [Spinacia oleracea]|uniref:Pentatricopeptide repeat-containing protein At2g17140 isoform X2 n=1 Tax=Spinacia oleracea TaxID=3562 RepID=A0ABM3RTV4_SPIOL|nr:pentatricopeptide repeat-containing protein At2g17140 isoform X2 [Spinacia oleracea]
MNQNTLNKALLKNSINPALAWQIFKRIISNPSSSSFALLNSLPIIAQILVRAKMYPQLDTLHHHLLLLHKQSASPSLFSLVCILAKSGLVDEAVSQFQSARKEFPHNPPPVYVYNVLLESSVRENKVNWVPLLYKDMFISGVSPEVYTFNLLIRGLCDSGHLKDARKVLDKMPERGCKPNEFSFGILIRGYCRNRLSVEGLVILGEMRRSGLVPNKVVYNTLISSFCKEGNDVEAEKLLEMMRKDGLVPDVITFNSRIAALCKAGKMLEASRIFRDMQIDDALGLPRPNIVTFNQMLEGFCRTGMLEEAEILVDTMKKSDRLMTLESYNIWLMGLVRKGKLLEAQLVLKEMLEKGKEPNIYSYNTVIDGLCKNNMLSDAKRMIKLMQDSGIQPDTVTYSSLLHGYCSKGIVAEANATLNEMMAAGCLPNIYTCNILLHSLWREGKIPEAESLLQKMNEKGYDLDTVTCNIVIRGLCRSGKLDKAIEIVDGMWNHGKAALGNEYIGLVDVGSDEKKCCPDVITYSIIIKDLCEAGRLEDAKNKLIEMVGEFRAAQEVFEIALTACGHKEALYSTMFNELLLGGEIIEACELFEIALDLCLYIGNFNYNDLFDQLCKNEKLDDATNALFKLINKEYNFDPASFMPVIDALCKLGKKHEADELAERMTIMSEQGEITNTVCHNNYAKLKKKGEGKWRNIVHREDGSGIALEALKRVQKGWGQGSAVNLPSLKAEANDYWQDAG